MIGWLQRYWFVLLLDLQVILALALPGTFFYLRWLLVLVVVLATYMLVRQFIEHRWVLWILRKREVRMMHGLEHATLAVLAEQDAPVLSGHTHRPNAFAVQMTWRQGSRLAEVRLAAEAAIRRLRAGERSLAYHPGCGTSALVYAGLCWLFAIGAAIFAFALGVSIEGRFAMIVIAGHLWYALETPFGLLAQRLFTVTALSTPARVCHVRLTNEIGQTEFEVVVDIRPALTDGGLVIPGVG